MQLWVRRVVALLSLFVLAALAAGTAAAQGVTSASITGRVTQDGGAPVSGATVVVTNSATGQRFQVVTREGGRFNIENLPPGGPYTVEVRAIGFQAGRRTGVRLELGQRYAGDFALKQAVVEVQELLVQAGQDPLINRGRTGSASTISDSAIANLPLLGRNFTDLIVTSPAVVAVPNGGPSIAGANNRFNNIQLDGSANNDLFGLGSTGAPGGQTGGKAVSLDAVSEFQVLVAPFDVRQSGFTGGLVNAVTKSGTNRFEGSVYLFNQTDALVGLSPVDNSKVSEFSINQFGGSIGGPIVRDRAHFFASLELQKRTFPYGGVLLNLSDPAVADSVQQFQDRIAALGGSAGAAGGFDFTNPNTNSIVKITAQAGPNGQVELSNNYASSENQTISRSTSGAYQLSGGGYGIRNTNNTTRFKWTSVFGGRFNNELFAGYSRIRDRRDPNTNFPTIIVDYGPYDLVTGAERFSQDNSLDQDIWEFKDNVTWDIGQHRVTVGTDNQFFGFRNAFFPQSIGQWTFSNLANFQAGVASRFDRALPAAGVVPGGRADPTAEFDVRQWGLFAQDRFSPTPNLNLTIGLRADIPTFPSTPPSNPTFKALGWSFDGQELDTGTFPSGNILWAPRLGANYDVTGTGDLIIRGGVGVFSGRPPYVWLSNAYGNSGLEQVQLTCTGGNVPNFNLFGLDPNNQPTSCGAGPTQPLPTLNLFSENFKFPQSLRVNLGVDKKLPLGIVATVDLLYANSMSSMMIEDRNLSGVVGTLAGEGNRPLYGNVDTLVVTAQRRTSAFGPVLVHYNRGNEYSYSGTFQLQKRFSDGYEFSAGYTYGHAYDMFSQTSSIAFSNYGFATLDGTLGDRALTKSAFDRPHKVTLSGTVALPYRVDFSLIYIGVSGTPYAYVANGDLNGDGVGGTNREFNDLIYVPRDASDITMMPTGGDGGAAEYAAFDEYINAEPCLKEQRGRIMERNSCRNPWANFVNARLTWNVPTTRGQRFELSAEMFNVLNWLNSDWGQVRQTSFFEGATLLKRVNNSGDVLANRFDVTNQRHVYDFIGNTSNLKRVQTTDSRWRMQLGGRYSF